MTAPQEAAAHRHNGYVVGSRVDVALRPPDADDDLLLIVSTPNSSSRCARPVVRTALRAT